MYMHAARQVLCCTNAWQLHVHKPLPLGPERSHSEERAIWVVVKIMVPFCVLNTVRHLVGRGPKKRTVILTATIQMNC